MRILAEKIPMSGWVVRLRIDTKWVVEREKPTLTLFSFLLSFVATR